jgi:hypothetical protein
MSFQEHEETSKCVPDVSPPYISLESRTNPFSGGTSPLASSGGPAASTRSCAARSASSFLGADTLEPRGVEMCKTAKLTLSRIRAESPQETERERRPSPITSPVGSPLDSKSRGNQPCLLQRRHKSNCRQDRERSRRFSGRLLLRPLPSADSPADPLRLGERSTVSPPAYIRPKSQASRARQTCRSRSTPEGYQHWDSSRAERKF